MRHGIAIRNVRLTSIRDIAPCLKCANTGRSKAGPLSEAAAHPRACRSRSVDFLNFAVARSAFRSVRSFVSGGSRPVGLALLRRGHRS